REDAHGRRLPRPVRSEQGEHLARSDLQVDAVEHPRVPEGLGQALDLNCVCHTQECTPYTEGMARGLTVEQITEAAVAIADEQGLAAVSMATVAKRCGFTTMSLYRHVASKDELVWRMLDMGLGPAPPYTFSGWRVGLAWWAQGLMDRLREHPWGIDVPINGTLPTYGQLCWLTRGLAVVDGTGTAA